MQCFGVDDPGIITFDGAVINANRRMAIFQVLQETGDDRYSYLNVARLPKGIDEKDLWKIEAKLQFGRDFRLEYGPVNELLKIRAGKESGLTAKQISEALLGRYSEAKVEERLKVLKFIDITSVCLTLQSEPSIKYMVLISGYESNLYKDYLTRARGWKMHRIKTTTRGHNGKDSEREEIIWYNDQYYRALKSGRVPVHLSAKERQYRKVNPKR